MARRPRAIRITPKLIEFEDHFIRVPNIATITIGPDPKRRRLALILLCVGTVLLWLSTQTTQHFGAVFGLYDGSRAGPRSFVLVGLGLAAISIAIHLLRYLALFISTADSRFTVLIDRHPRFMREVMERIREALLANEASPIFYQVNVQAERIERIDASTNSVEVVNSPGAAVVAGDAIGSEVSSMALPAPQPAPRMPAPAAVPPIEQIFDSVLARAGGVSPSLHGMLQGARGPAPQPQQQQPVPVVRDSKPALSQLDIDRSSRAVHVAQSPGAITVGGNVHTAAFATHVVASPVTDLDALMKLLIERDVAHHQQLNSYLAAVRDHLAGGPTPREQAAGYWHWFADYAVASLSDIEGVIALVERIGTIFR